MDNTEQDPPNADFVTGYVRLPNEDNQANRNSVLVTHKQILSAVLCVLTVIGLLLIAIIIILLKTYNQIPYITYNTTTAKITTEFVTKIES
jgi:hypothetical protein